MRVSSSCGRRYAACCKGFLWFLAVFACVAAARDARGACVKAYEHDHFGGAQWDILCDNGAPFSAWNDKVSSFKIPPDRKLVAYEHSNFSGASRTYIGDVPSVGGELNDKISALQLSYFDTSGCITAYRDADYKGEQYAFCPGLAHPPFSRWNDEISSVRVPRGAKAMFCEHTASEGFGACRSYFGDVPSLGAANDTFSWIQWGGVELSDFTMAVMSDTQYGFCSSSACLNGPGDSYVANEWHSQSVKTMRGQVGFDQFAGVIINGDITHTMDHTQIESFIEDYAGLNLYLGLGNHDYDNHVDDKACDGGFIGDGRYRAWAQNLCAIRLLKWFESSISSIPMTGRDYSYDGEDLVGSMAYSFDVGSWHFVQLNNHPSYHRFIKAYDSADIVHRSFDIHSSLPWLRRDLAAHRHKKVALNVHVMNADRFSLFSQPAGYDELGRIIDDYPQVVAIFAGHLHGNVGHQASSTYRLHTPGGRIVPVIFSGAAETNSYLRVDFREDHLAAAAVSSHQGNVVHLNSGDTQVACDHVRIRNRWRPEDRMRVTGGAPGSDLQWEAAHWQLVPVQGTSYVRIQSRLDAPAVLHIENGALASGPAPASWLSAQWSLEPVAGTSHFRLRNRWKPAQMLNIEHGSLASSVASDGWLSAHWSLETVDGTGFVLLRNRWLPRRVVHVEAGPVSCDAGEAQWLLEPVAGTDYVRLRPRHDPAEAIHIEYGDVQLGAAPWNWLSAQWLPEPVAGTDQVRLRNRWKPSEVLHIENGELSSGTAPDGWLSAQWTLEPVCD